MKCYLLDQMQEQTEIDKAGEYVILSDKQNWIRNGEKLGIYADVDTINMNGHFSKVETQSDYLFGQVSVPRVLDLFGARHEIFFFVNERGIIFADENDYVQRILEKIRTKKDTQAFTKEQFLYNFISQILKNDIQILDDYEVKIIKMEERITDDKMQDFHKKMMPIRRELLVMKSYYEQISEMGKELEENEDGIFANKRLKLFRFITDKADRLERKCGQLLDYSQQLRDVYQSQVDAKQNKTIELLTVISSVFFPLTLLTSWYGMNFKNMPELENGYPVVVVAAIFIVVGTVWLFKRKKIL